MKILILILSIFALTGCGPGVLKATDESLQVYVDQFRAEAERRGYDLPELNYLKITIVPAATLPGLHGVCRTEEGTTGGFVPVKRKSIQISETAINRGEFATRVTMFHELAHCILEMEHTEDHVNVSIHHSGVSYAGQMPISIMAPRYFNAPQVPVAELYWNQYVDELFGVRENPFH